MDAAGILGRTEFFPPQIYVLLGGGFKHDFYMFINYVGDNSLQFDEHSIFFKMGWVGNQPPTSHR